MHRQNPLQQAFVAYSSGGARALVEEISDNPMMQEMKGSFMGGENREKIESPQNYGFTSVVMKATKGKDGSIEECAEAYISFLGGNRSFPVATVMDDRRYRLKELKPGDVAFFDHQQQQFHFNEKGAFLTGLDNKKIRIALHKVEEEKQSSGKEGVEALAEGGSSGSSSGGSQKKKGQKQRYEKAEKESKRFFDLNEKTIDVAHDATINVKAAKTLNLEGTDGINYKTKTHTFDGDVIIKGELRVKKSIYTDLDGFKPTGPEWAPGGTGALDADEEVVKIEQLAAVSNKINILPDGSVIINGDFTVTGNLTVNGVIRAKGFEKI